MCITFGISLQLKDLEIWIYRLPLNDEEKDPAYRDMDGKLYIYIKIGMYLRPNFFNVSYIITNFVYPNVGQLKKT